MQFLLAILTEVVCGSIIGSVVTALLIAVSTIVKAKTQSNASHTTVGDAYMAWFYVGIAGFIGSIVDSLLSAYLVWIGIPLSYTVIGSLLLAGWSIVLCPDLHGLGSSWFIPWVPLITALGSIRILASKIVKGLYV